MKFSEYFKITRKPNDTWFDPILTHDTKLFIDPLLIKKQPISPFDNAHEKIVDFFDRAFKEAAKTSPDWANTRYRRLLANLVFPEVRELCLGYADSSTSGSGSGGKVAKLFAAGIFESLAAGVEHLDHFEEVTLFQRDIGADRISDMAGNILRSELIKYTQRICKRYKIPVENVTFDHGVFGGKRWEPIDAELPVNPYGKTPKAVLLVPRAYLRKLPEIHWEAFGYFLSNIDNQQIRDELGLEIKEELDRDALIQMAREHRDLADKFAARMADRRPTPYNLIRDPNRLYRWYGDAKQFARENPMALLVATTPEECLSVVDLIVDQYQRFVEQKGGWMLLWNENGRHKNERAAQKVFYAIALGYCQANNIDVTPEAETGRGPVDFKFSNGFTQRVLLEVKLASNSELQHGITVQTPTYMKAEGTKQGRIVVVAHETGELEWAGPRVMKWIDEAREKHKLELGYRLVSAVKPLSASKAKARHH